MLASDKTVEVSASHEEGLSNSLEQFELRLRGMDRSQRTIDNYTNRIRQVVKIVGKDPIDWGSSDIYKLTTSKKWTDPPRPDGDGWARDTKILTKSALKSYWEIFERDDLLKHRTFWKMASEPGGLAKYNKTKEKTPNPQDVERIKEICKEIVLNPPKRKTKLASHELVYRHFLTYLIAMFGVRVKAICNMRLCDFHLDGEKPYLHIFKTKNDKSRDVIIDEPIGELLDAFKKAREVIINNLIENYQDNHQVLGRLESLLNSDEAWLFFNRKDTPRTKPNGSGIGNPMLQAGIYGVVKYVTQDIVGHNINPHGFRHAKAFELLEKEGYQPHEVRNYLGHENIQTTLDYCPQGLDEQAAALERARARNGNGGAPDSYRALQDLDKTPAGSLNTPRPGLNKDQGRGLNRPAGALNKGPGKESNTTQGPPINKGNGREETITILANLNRQGVLTDSAFAAAVAAMGVE